MKKIKFVVVRWFQVFIFEFKFQCYLDELKDQQLLGLIALSKKMGDAERMQRLFENTPEEKLLSLYSVNYDETVFQFLLKAAKKLKDVMRAERVYRAAPDGTDQEFRAAQAAMSFW